MPEAPDLREEFAQLLHQLKQRVAALPEQWLDVAQEESNRIAEQEKEIA